MPHLALLKGRGAGRQVGLLGSAKNRGPRLRVKLIKERNNNERKRNHIHAGFGMAKSPKTLHRACWQQLESVQ